KSIRNGSPQKSIWYLPDSPPVSSFQSLITFGTNNIKYNTCTTNAPFPADITHLEYNFVQFWDIYCWKQCQTTTHHRNEERFIPEQIHLEYRLEGIFHFKSVDED